MYSEHLRMKLREANVDPAQASDQLFWRAASQVNTYIGLLNARLEIKQENDDKMKNIENMLLTLHSIQELAKADPGCT